MFKCFNLQQSRPLYFIFAFPPLFAGCLESWPPLLTAAWFFSWSSRKALNFSSLCDLNYLHTSSFHCPLDLMNVVRGETKKKGKKIKKE